VFLSFCWCFGFCVIFFIFSFILLLIICFLNFPSYIYFLSYFYIFLAFTSLLSFIIFLQLYIFIHFARLVYAPSYFLLLVNFSLMSSLRCHFFLLSNIVIFIYLFFALAFSVTHFQHYPWFLSHTLYMFSISPSTIYILFCASFFSRFSLFVALFPVSSFTLFFSLFTRYLNLCFHPFLLSLSISFRFISIDKDRINHCCRRGWTLTDWWRLSLVMRGCKKRGMANCIMVGVSIVTVLNERS